MAKRRARAEDAARDLLDEEDEDDYVPPREFGRRRSRRRGKPWGKLLVVLGVLAATVAALPTIVANTSLRNSLLAGAVPDGSLRVTATGASLGWFTPPSLSGVEIFDAAGEKLATVEAVRLNRTPLALLSNRNNLGEIEVEKPVVYVAVLPDGTNWQKALAPLLEKPAAAGAAAEPAAATASPNIEASIRIIDGTVLVEETSTNERWRLFALNAQIDTRGVAVGLPPLSVTGQLDSPNGAMPTPASFSLAIANDQGRQQLSVALQNLPLAAAESWLRMELPGSTLRGSVFGQGTANWMATAANPLSDGSTNGKLTLQNVEFAAPELAGDTVRLAAVEIPWRLTSQASGVTIDDLQLTSGVGRFAVRGKLDPALTNIAARHDVEFQGELELAPLAAMLPHLLRIRSDTKINSGRLELAGRSQPVEGGQSLSGMLRTANISATSGGRPLSWDQPINATFEVRRELGNLRLESLKCQSDFLSIAAAGTTQQLTANANFDLNRLAAQLGQFVDLSGTELAGTGTAHLDWLEKDGTNFAISANSEVAQLRVGLGDGKVYAEPRLSAKATALGNFDPLTHQPVQIASGELQVAAEGDLLDAKLIGPVDFAATERTWPVSINLTGDIARWMARLRPWFAPDPWQASGTGDVTAQVRAGATAAQVSQAKVTLTNLQVTGAGWNIVEPRVELTGDLEWNAAAGEIAARSLQLVSSTVTFAAQNLQLQTDATPPRASGVAAFRADIARVAAWQVAAAQPKQYQPSGMVTANVRFEQLSDRISAEFTGTGEQLALRQLATAANPVATTIWQEPQVNVRGTTTYEAAADRIAFRQVQVQSATLALMADGQVDRLSTTADLNANGSLNYDLAKVTPLLKPFVGEGIQLLGSETARFQAAGSLKNPAASWARTLAARGELPWSSANIYGLPIGPGKLAATLGDGTVRVDPLAIAVAEGQLTMSPQVRLDPEPMELTLPAGPVLTNVRISPQVSEAMLKYIAPVLAGATQSEGQFSMTLSGARIPLADSKKADVAGQLAVHSVRVVPGPMAKQWVELAQQVEALAKKQDLKSLAQRQPVSLLSVQDQQVNFRVVDGRVYHQGMQFQVGDVVMRTEGSVGLDETVAIVVHVPIQDKWLEGKAFLVGLRGQSLAIPISGTLRNPKMDQSAVAGLSQQLLQGAAQQAIGGELNKALDKLLKPR